jgi:hypothetical protein
MRRKSGTEFHRIRFHSFEETDYLPGKHQVSYLVIFTNAAAHFV